MKENYLEGRTEPINTLEEKQRFQRGLAKRRKERFLKNMAKTIKFGDIFSINKEGRKNEKDISSVVR